MKHPVYLFNKLFKKVRLNKNNLTGFNFMRRESRLWVLLEIIMHIRTNKGYTSYSHYTASIWQNT